MPRLFSVISSRTSRIGMPNGTSGRASPRCMISLTLTKPRPMDPPGCSCRSCAWVTPRAAMVAIARASPMASIRVEEVVGAILAGHASRAAGRTSATVAARITIESAWLPRPITGQPSRCAWARIGHKSGVLPELDSTISRSSRVIMPRSPCAASAGWTKNAGVPVAASVAAILRPTCPDLPMPVTIARDRVWSSRLTASANRASRPIAS